MNLLFVHDHKFILDGSGGVFSPGKFTLKSFDRYLEFFDEICIVSRSDSQAANKENCDVVVNEKISFIEFPNLSVFHRRFIFRYLYKIKLNLIVNKFSALVIRLPSEIGFLAAEIALQYNIPYVCEVVACPVDAMDGNGSIKALLYKKIIERSMKKAVLNASGALYVTNFFLQKRYPTNGFTTNASNVEITDFLPPKKHKNKEKYKLMLVGNLDSEHKGYDVLYQALDALDTQINFIIEVVLVGYGEKYKIDKAYKNIQLVYTGGLRKNQIFNLFEEVDLYLQPSSQEGLPRATIEAMSRGLPCVVSNAGGLPELISSSFVHDKNSPDELAEIILILLGNENLYNTAAIENLACVKQYSSDLLKIKRRNFYKKLYSLKN